MDGIYKQIWEAAKPYYEKGRPMDLDHIGWMMEEAISVCEKENLDASLLLPLVILHDVGYSESRPGNPFRVDIKKEHMEKGARIAAKILEELRYDAEKAERIAHMVSIHDNWAIGDSQSFLDDLILGTFNDLDFMWMATPKGFPAVMEIRKVDAREMLEYLETNDKLAKRPFSTKTTGELFERYTDDRRKEMKPL